jgi:hypothetical protein
VPVVDVIGLQGPPGVLVYSGGWGDDAPVRTVPVPDELVFDEFQRVNADDAEAIAAFEAEHGRLGASNEPSQAALLSWARPEEPLDEATLTFPPFVGDYPESWKNGRLPWYCYERPALAALDSMYPDLEQRSDVQTILNEHPRYNDTLVADWSHTARMLRACALHLEALTMPRPERAVQAVWREQGFHVADAADASRWFGVVINERLRPFQLCVLVGNEDERSKWISVQLENALALQIRNYCDASFHRCENELCGRVFPIGLDGRKRRRFCSEVCAKRQSVRDARRKKKGQA